MNDLLTSTNVFENGLLVTDSFGVKLKIFKIIGTGIEYTIDKNGYDRGGRHISKLFFNKESLLTLKRENRLPIN